MRLVTMGQVHGRVLRVLAPPAVLLAVVLAAWSQQAPQTRRRFTSAAAAEVQAPADATATPQNGRPRLTGTKHRAVRTDPPLLGLVALAAFLTAGYLGLVRDPYALRPARRRRTGASPSRAPPVLALV
jgi:hypothetical protein